jgi:hypothetical protein
MDRRGSKLSTLLISLAVSIGVVLAFMNSFAGAQDIEPVETAVVPPSAVEASSTYAPQANAGPLQIKTRRLMTPVGDAEYKLIKSQAATKPAQSAELLPSSGSQPGPQPRTVSSITSFVGLDRNSAASGGQWNPPDTIVAKSFNHVLEAANSAVRLFNTTGTVLDTKTLNAFFGASTTDGILFDPKVYFDRLATNKRFYVVSLQQNDVPALSKIWLAISRSQDPTSLAAANWCVYSIEGRKDIGTANESWADYPGLGVGPDSILITDNQFTFSTSNFTYAVVTAINKITIANNAASCPSLTTFTFTTQSDPNAFTLQPVQHFTSPSSFAGTTNPAYLLSTIFGNSAAYTVWQLRNVAGGSPTLRSVNVTGSFTYDLPPSAPQSGSATLLDTGDDRMVQAAGVGNALSGVHGTSCNMGGGAAESCVRFVRIAVGQDGPGNLTASIKQQRTFGGGAGVFYFWPGIAVNNRNQTAIDFLRSSATSFLSAWWTMKDLASTIFEAASPITNGTCGQSSDRTGDFVGMQADPSDFVSFWMAGERATTVAGSCQWQTQIMKITPGSEIINLAP